MLLMETRWIFLQWDVWVFCVFIIFFTNSYILVYIDEDFELDLFWNKYMEQVIIQKFTLNRGRCVWQLLPSTVEVLLCRGSHDWPFLVTGQC